MKDIIRGRIRYFPSGLSGRKVPYPVFCFLYLSYLNFGPTTQILQKKPGWKSENTAEVLKKKGFWHHPLTFKISSL